jgi:nitrogen fixation-related uncharacterized protein
MTIVWLLFISSVILLPCTALLALRWAVRHHEFTDLPKTALSIFDDDEPVGRQTDFFPGRQGTAPGQGSPTDGTSEPSAPHFLRS